MLQFLYRNVLRRTSTLVLTTLVGAFFFERTFNLATESYFDAINKGKQWKDIKHKYVTQ